MRADIYAMALVMWEMARCTQLDGENKLLEKLK